MKPSLQDIRTKQLPGLGCQKLMNRINDLLLKGDHVSLVAPRYMGKTCIARALRSQQALRDRFEAIALCDLRHEALTDNQSFFACILRHLEADPAISEDWREFCAPPSPVAAWRTLLDLAQGLASEGKRMLVILDGLDQVALNPAIDEGAWNNLNSLIDCGGMQFVTTSCDALDCICLDPQSRGSLFFQRFADAVVVPAIGPDDLDEWLGVTACGPDGFDKGARSELLNETGGHPRLLGALLGVLPEGGGAAEITAAADRLAQDGAGDLLAVFNELSPDVREALATLEEPGKTTREARKALLQRGLVREGKGGKLEQCCKLMSRLSECAKPGDSTLRELFGSDGAFFSNASHVLRLRLSSVAAGSGHSMFRLSSHILDSLHDPSSALMLLRRVEDEVFDVVENLVGANFPKLLVKDAPNRFKAGDRFHNVRVLDCLTREDAGYSNDKLPRSIYVLTSTLHSAANYANHPQGQVLSAGLAHAMTTTVLELAAEMKRVGLIR